MQFKHIIQPIYNHMFRVYHKPDGKLYRITGFDDDGVFAKIDGEAAVFERRDCEIEQWTGLLDQEKKMIFVNDVVELRNINNQLIGLFVVCFNSLEGRYVLDGITPGANSSRLTYKQHVRIVGNKYDREYAGFLSN